MKNTSLKLQNESQNPENRPHFLMKEVTFATPASFYKGADDSIYVLVRTRFIFKYLCINTGDLLSVPEGACKYLPSSLDIIKTVETLKSLIYPANRDPWYGPEARRNLITRLEDYLYENP